MFRSSIAAVCVVLGLAVAPVRAALDAPVSPNAQPGVAITLQFFENIRGSYMLSGQQEIAWDERRKDEDINYIIEKTGRTPAVRGFDYLKYTESAATRAGYAATERAIGWARQGGIVTFCIHMFMNIGSTNGQPQFYAPSANSGNGTTFDIRQAVISGTPENTEFLAKLDICAEELIKLRDAGVTVIWRPFHECGGTWFWWSFHGAEPFKAAWRIMFERYTQVHKLNNLIWCYNPIDSFSILQNWYPGDEMVDMISLDVYPNAGTHPTYSADYKRMRDFKAGRKIVVMSENGAIPDVDALFNEGGSWGYFCTWNGFENNLSRNTVEFLNTAFNHEKVITLDELPALWAANTPRVTTAPQSQAVVAGASTVLSVGMAGRSGATLQWQRNGAAVDNATGVTLTLDDVQPDKAGLYSAVVTSGIATSTSAAAIVGVTTTSKVIGSGQELQPVNITHPNGNVFDQVLITGSAEAITADFAANQITRTSFIDLDNDIVQIEFSGPGTLSLVLDAPAGPAAPVNYNQPTVSYMKGLAGIVITGADERTNVSVFTVGRATAFDPTGGFNILQPVSATNNPANNGSSLFSGQAGTTYDGFADIAFIAISSTNGRFGGVRAANANFYATRGLTGVYAPGVALDGPLFIGNIDAFDSATPVIQVGSASDVRITGGDLLQSNTRAVQISGIMQLKFAAGSDSHGNLLAAKTNRGVLHRDGVNVTTEVVVNP